MFYAQSRKWSLITTAWIIGLAGFAATARAQVWAARNETKFKFRMPTGWVADPEIKFGYYHHLEDQGGEVSVLNLMYHTVDIPDSGSFNNTEKGPVDTLYHGGKSSSQWKLRIENGIDAAPKYFAMDVQTLFAGATAPTRRDLQPSSAVSKSVITVNGVLAWLRPDDGDLKRRRDGMLKKALAKGKTGGLETPAEVKELIKDNGFKGAPALGLIDSYAETPGASWDVSEEFLEIDGNELANFTFGLLAANDAAVYSDEGDYEGFLRLEATGDGGVARVDSWSTTIDEGMLVDASAILENGEFTATGVFADLQWAFEYSGGDIVAAILNVDELPEIEWDITRDEINPDSSYWQTARPFSLQAEAVAYDVAVPEPTSVLLLALGALGGLRRR